MHPFASDQKPSAPSRSFDLLHEKVQRWIWEQGWAELRGIQEGAVAPILGASADVIISATTAGGKTEAAFLPICSRYAGDASGSFRALYVSPLKALINDQFQRLEDLCRDLSIPVHRWHGDVPHARKRESFKRPSGFLLITPESLEALFVTRGQALRRAFSNLGYVVVDELHAFIGSERGRQLQSLLHRLELVIGHRIPRVALSATLGDMRLAADFLRPGEADEVRLVASSEGVQELRLQLRGYELKEVKSGDKEPIQAEDVCDGSLPDICQHLFRVLRGTDNLIFANARAVVETCADLLRRVCESTGTPNEFFAHHGSLSKALREEVEAFLKDKSRPTNVVCTTTLELGIDIGTVTSIAQIGCPPSVASMRQRLGRSGRRGDPAVMRIYIQEVQLTSDSTVEDRLRAELVQAVAMVQLLILKWYEPPPAEALHLSTLVQQTLSLIAQYGGITPARSWHLLCETGPFRSVSKTMYADFLRSLGRAKLLDQMDDGTLLLGALGEKIVEHYSFFAAFQTPEEYRLVCRGSSLGSLPTGQPLSEGSFLIFAGRRWKVLSIDPRQRVIEVEPSDGGRPPLFAGNGINVHDRVREQMRCIYISEEVPSFLDAKAQSLLAEGQSAFRMLELQNRSILMEGRDTLIFPWRGDRVLDTMTLQFQKRGLRATRDGLSIVVTDLGLEHLVEHCQALVHEGPADPTSLASGVDNKEREKYDQFLSDGLLSSDYAARSFDVEGAWKALCNLVGAVG